MKPECSFRQSELTTSNMASAYAGIEAAEDQIPDAEGIDDIKSALEDAVNGLQESYDMYDEANSNWAGGERENEEWVEKMDEIQSAIDEIENWEPDQTPEDVDPDDYESDEDYKEDLGRILQEEKDNAIDFINGLSLP